jgi:hypothetical protein
MLKTSSAFVKVLPALALWFLQPLAAVANTITFTDSSVTTDIPSRVSGGCVVGVPEVCTVQLLPPSPPPGGGTSWQQTLNILEPTDNTISDTLTINGTFDTNFNVLSFTLIFTSGDNLSSVGGNILREDGTLQTASSINWFNPTGGTVVTDVIKFQSGETPEPSTVLLILVGFAPLGLAAVRRRLKASRALESIR